MLFQCIGVLADDQIPQLLAKLENASVERCCKSAQQLLSYMEQAENKAVCKLVNVDQCTYHCMLLGSDAEYGAVTNCY